MSSKLFPVFAALALALAGCTATPSEPPPPPASAEPPAVADTATPSPSAQPADLGEPAAQVAVAATQCALPVSQPAEYVPAAVQGLAEHATQWAAAWDAVVAVPEIALTPEACVDALELAVRRLEDQAMAADDDRAWSLLVALRFDWAAVLGAGPPDDPGVSGLAGLPAPSLEDLALAEDQAGFVEEFLAARVADQQRADLAALAGLHRARAARLASALAATGGKDPRAPAYTYPTLDPGPLPVAAQAEYALASHYAATPDHLAVAAIIQWQLIKATTLGHPVPPFPFLTP